MLELLALGWEVAVEVSFSRFGERGSIDVLAFYPIRRALLVSELKSVTDMQAMLGGLDRKGRLGPAIARDRDWDPWLRRGSSWSPIRGPIDAGSRRTWRPFGGASGTDA